MDDDTDYSDDEGDSGLPDLGSATPVTTSNGTLSKATDTALDIAGIVAQAGAQKLVGAIFPTGQTNPAALTAAAAAKPATSTNTILIIAAVAAAGLVALVALR